jgi:hypothetical protein
MRKQTAIVAIAVLFVITAFCPSLVCSPAHDAHACCPHSPHRQTDSQTCPYLLLAKATSVSVPVAVPPLRIATVVVVPEPNVELAGMPTQVYNSSELSLRHRILLL